MWAPSRTQIKQLPGLFQRQGSTVVSAWAQQTDGISLSLGKQLQFNTAITNIFMFLKPCPNKTNPIPAMLQHRQKRGTCFCHRAQLHGVHNETRMDPWINHQAGESSSSDKSSDKSDKSSDKSSSGRWISWSVGEGIHKKHYIVLSHVIHPLPHLSRKRK